ncbi:MAG: ATP-binding cassette domain-containing protein, partial [Patescibacteria group bacterium]|nr:ATP-binding cassette domain-containing protein [Patescibacteria group bacterium]
MDFSYKDGTQVLHDFSLDIPAGKKFALVGKSGNGKSTIIKLIMGFVRPQVGQVVIDDQDLSET